MIVLMRFSVYSLTCAIVLAGLPIIVLARLLTKTVVKSCTIHLCKVFNKPAISLTDYHKRTRPLNKHFTQGFKLPPIFVSDLLTCI